MPGMTPRLEPFRSIPEVCDIEVVTKPGAEPGLDAARPDLLIEVPHGATRRCDFEATRRRLVGEYPDDLDQYFYVNTDVGSIECARWVAEMVVKPSEFPDVLKLTGWKGKEPGVSVETVLIVRGLLARTFVDLNRVAAPDDDRKEGIGGGSLTPAIPDYVTWPEDIDTLLRLHREYQDLAERAYEVVCGRPETSGAVVLHTYAPRVVEIDQVDEGIVAALRKAYQSEVFATLRKRPDVDLITETSNGNRLAPESLVRSVREAYARIGIEAAENESYRLHRSSMGYLHSAKYPGRVLTVEISRELLADPFTPFVEMSIRASKARRMAAPIAAALLANRGS